MDQKLIESINNQVIKLGVTGLSGSGKSYGICQIVLIAKFLGINIKCIKVDNIMREIFANINNLDINLKNKIINEFGNTIVNKNGIIDSEILIKLIYKNLHNLGVFRKIVNHILDEEIQKRMEGQKGLILIEWTYLAEDGLMPLVDYNVLLIFCSKSKRIIRLRNRGHSEDRMLERYDLDPSVSEYLALVKKIQEESMKGSLFLFETTSNPRTEDYRDMLNRIFTSVANI